MITLPWGQSMEAIVQMLKNEKISSTMLILVLLGAWYAYGWAGEEFVKSDDFNKLTTLIVTHVEDMKIVNAAQLLRDKELAMQIAVATQESEKQIKHIQDEINQARQYKNCLIRKEPNCKHLRPPE